ncbi:MAG: SDR family oxidoreductase [Bryobacterales bacterium]|nr:SDR family oxidoreductase [Bryobacterales bacterium]
MNEQPLQGKVAVITGASRGLGRAMALALAEAGIRVALVGRDEAKLAETAQGISALGGEHAIFLADVSREEPVDQLKAAIHDRYGSCDILINNAGINLRKNITDFTLAEWNSVIDANLTSVFLMCRAFVPGMKGKGYGRIINMTSIMSHISLPGRAAYSSSKAALLGLTRALALELASEGITVNGISPGPVATEINTAILNNPEANAQFVAKIPVGRWGLPEEIGKLALYLCQPEAGFITGTDILIDGGWCAA